MLNLLPKSMIINNIVDTLKKDPEGGVIKLLEKLKPKEYSERALLQQVIAYYKNSTTAKMQIKNLVYNTSQKTLYTFSENLYDSFSTIPISLNFMQIMTMNEASNLNPEQLIFPMIDLKSLNDTSKAILARLKNDGQIFFVSIAVTEENFDTVTADEVIFNLIKCGVRGIFYRMSDPNISLEASLVVKIHQIRTERPILAFFMKKDAPHSRYIITEHVGGNDYDIRLNLR